ncbi:hypothetical protein KC19_7G105100 [Ceratodon purpureus]|uniref:Uncharacterized protein n=1 Tax=Ceratodon purpureus TaxID=3225 RepID=A0A8T0H8L7_CERPU|nr:hypothetical protein KC19_7G105100 [Ceratodon purpureus]
MFKIFFPVFSANFDATNGRCWINNYCFCSVELGILFELQTTCSSEHETDFRMLDRHGNGCTKQFRCNQILRGNVTELGCKSSRLLVTSLNRAFPECRPLPGQASPEFRATLSFGRCGRVVDLLECS